MVWLTYIIANGRDLTKKVNLIPIIVAVKKKKVYKKSPDSIKSKGQNPSPPFG